VTSWAAGLLLGAALAWAAPASARDTLRMLALSDALAPAVLDAVGHELGAEIVVDGLATSREVEAALRSSPAAYDVVVLPADAIGSRIRPDLLSPLDPTAVPEAAAVQPSLMAALGAAARVALPFDWSPTGFLVDTAKLKDAGPSPDRSVGWDVLGRPDMLRRALACGFGWPTDARDAFAIVAGASASGAADVLDRRRSLALLAQLRAEARKGSAAERAAGVAGGDLCAATLPAPDALLAIARARAGGGGSDLAFVLPASEGVLAIDIVAVPAASRDHAGALALLRALLRPEAVVTNARATHVAPAVGTNPDDPAFDPAGLARLRSPPPLDAALVRSVTAAWDRGASR
jgi:spermidine/putrescine-binding protein